MTMALPEPAPRPEMAQVSHHNLRLHNDSYRSPSLVSTITPPSPADPLAPFLHRAAPEPISTPGRAYFSPSRDSFASKPSVSDASHVHTSPSRSSLASEKRQSGGQYAGRAQEHRHGEKRHSKHSSGQRSHRPSRDVEHAAARPGPPYHTPARHGRSMASDHRTLTYEDGDGGPDEKELLESKAATFLLYLSFPVAIVSFLIAGWTFVCLFLFLLAQPLRLLHSRPSPSSELTSIISPALRLQLRLISSSAGSEEYSAGMLVVIHLISPFVSMGVVFAAWVAACFWFFSAILGDPAGGDGHNDGKATVVGVRNWWEAWLCRGLR